MYCVGTLESICILCDAPAGIYYHTMYKLRQVSINAVVRSSSICCLRPVFTHDDSSVSVSGFMFLGGGFGSFTGYSRVALE